MTKKSGLADSPFFTPLADNIPPVKSLSQPNDRTVAATERANDRTSNSTERPNGRTVYPERKTTRHSFEFYADQIQAIRRLRAQKELAGEPVSLSAMIRDAVDRYLDSHS